jgi:uncharacterized protein (TIGR02246 family)
MKWLNGYRIKLVLLGFVVGLMVGGGRSAKADFTFGTPTNLGTIVNTSYNDDHPSISADSLSLFFMSRRPGGYGNGDIWVVTRETKDDEWGTPMNLGSTVNTSSGDWGPSISADGLSLYFSSNRPGGYGGWDVWLTTRATVSDLWGTPVNLGPTVNTSGDDACPSVTPDGLSFYFSSTRPDGSGEADLWVTMRSTADDNWSTPVNLGPTVNTSAWDNWPNISADSCTLIFTSTRSGGYSEWDLWITRRATKEDDWGEPVNLGPAVNSSASEAAPCISVDGSTLYFQSRRPGGFGGIDLWQVSIEPVVDLNGDGIVDSADMCIMVDHWGTDEPLCDIGPTPLGDGIVDAQDMLVLTEYLTKEKVDVEADIAAINELYNQYCLGANTGDLDLFLSCWDENGIQLPSNTPARIGKEQIREGMKPLFDLYIAELSITPEDIEVAGDWAFGRRTYTSTLIPKAGGATIYIDGKALTIFKRQADGSWKIFRDCFNYNV